MLGGHCAIGKSKKAKAGQAEAILPASYDYHI
jgi:hypothetical protein